MKVRSIPTPTLAAVHTLLVPHVPVLTPAGLVDALRMYEVGERSRKSDPGEPPATVEEAARIMRVSKYSIRRWIREGMIPAEQIGRRWLIPLDALRALAQTRPAGGEA